MFDPEVFTKIGPILISVLDRTIPSNNQDFSVLLIFYERGHMSKTLNRVSTWSFADL